MAGVKRLTLYCLTLLVTAAPAMCGAQAFTSEDFSQNRVPRCSGNPAGTGPITLLVQIGPQLPPYQFTLISNPVPSAPGVAHSIGRIEISKPGASAPLQTIEARSIWDYGLCDFFSASDVNFDGYLDISFVREGGGKWGSRDYFVFDPHSGRFVANDFARQLGQVRENGIQLDAKAREIHAAFMGPGTCPGGLNIFRVENARLVQIQSEDVKPENGQCVRRVKKRVNGEWKVVQVKTEAEIVSSTSK